MKHFIHISKLYILLLKQQLTFQYDDSVDAFITTTSYIADSLNLVFCLFPPHWDVYSGCFLSLTQIWYLFGLCIPFGRVKCDLWCDPIISDPRLIKYTLWYSPLTTDHRLMESIAAWSVVGSWRWGNPIRDFFRCSLLAG
jgi:hypothetical protein